jgi:ribosomal protein S24E
MDIFQQTDTPSSEVREHLAEELGMTKREVQVCQMRVNIKIQ